MKNSLWVLLAVVFALAGGYAFYQVEQKERSPEAPFTAPKPTPPPKSGEVVARGIALSPDLLFDVIARADGTIHDIFVKKGQEVDADEIVITVYHPQRRATLLQLQSDLLQLQRLGSELKVLKDRVISRSGLFEKGLIPKTVLEDSQLAVSQKIISISKLKASMANHLADLSAHSMLDDRDFLGIIDEIEQSQGDFDVVEMEERLSRASTDEAGRVLEILVEENETVDVNEPLIRLERLTGEEIPLNFYCSTRVRHKNKIFPGMTAYISPIDVNPNEYGKIIGRIKHVSPFAMTQEEMFEKLRKKELVRFLTEGEASVLPFKVEPILDPETTSGYQWTKGGGPPFKIQNGALCLVQVPLE